MKQGKSIIELATEIERQAKTKRDFVVPTNKMLASVSDQGQVQIGIHNGGNPNERGPLVVSGELTPVAHRQLGDHVDIPAKYYDRMRANAPELLAQNINTWMHKSPSNRMMRMLDGKYRAVLSDRFNRELEYIDLFEAIFPVFQSLSLTVVACDVTDTRLYLKAVDKSVTELVPQGKKWGADHHIIHRPNSPAITISNSEVGMGSLSIEMGLYDDFCTNLAFFGGKVLRKQHVGVRHEITENFQALLSDATKRKTTEAVWSQVRDVVKGGFDPEVFKGRIKELVATQEQKITGKVEKVVELVGEKLGLNEGERGSVLRNLIEGGDLSRFGMYNAVTLAAEANDSFDRATDMERLGGKVIELNQNEWNELAKAA